MAGLEGVRHDWQGSDTLLNANAAKVGHIANESPTRCGDNGNSDTSEQRS